MHRHSAETAHSRPKSGLRPSASDSSGKSATVKPMFALGQPILGHAHGHSPNKVCVCVCVPFCSCASCVLRHRSRSGVTSKVPEEYPKAASGLKGDVCQIPTGWLSRPILGHRLANVGRMPTLLPLSAKVGRRSIKCGQHVGQSLTHLCPACCSAWSTWRADWAHVRFGTTLPHLCAGLLAEASSRLVPDSTASLRLVHVLAIVRSARNCTPGYSANTVSALVSAFVVLGPEGGSPKNPSSGPEARFVEMLDSRKRGNTADVWPRLGRRSSRSEPLGACEESGYVALLKSRSGKRATQVVRMKAMFNQIGPTLAEIGRNGADTGRIRANSAQILTEPRPKSATLARTPAEFGPNSTDVGMTSTAFDQLWLGIGRIRRFRPTSANTYPGSTKLGPNSTESGPISANFGPASATSDQHWPGIGQTNQKLARTLSKLA